MNKSAFLKWLAILPESVGKEELGFTDERKEAIFSRVDADGDGSVSAEDFTKLFVEKVGCVKAVTVTDKFEVEGAETICKLEANDELELSGEEKTDEKTGMIRRQCKVLKDGKTGWVTRRQGKQSFTYALIPYKRYCYSVDDAISKSAANIKEVSAFLAGKIRQTGSSKEGPLAEAREELGKLNEEVKKALTGIEEVRQKFASAKKEWQATERAEMNAHIEAKNKKEAAALVDVVIPEVEKVEALAKAVTEAAAPVSALNEEETLAFATPSAVQESVESLVAKTTEPLAAARKIAHEQMQEASKVTPPTGGSAEAKRQLAALLKRVEESQKAVRTASNQLRKACAIIVTSKKAAAAAALRKESQATHGGDCEKMFAGLANGGDSLAEDAFCKKLMALDGVSMPADHAKLLCRSLARGSTSLSKRDFLRYVQLFYEIVKDIAFTNSLDIGTCKTLRKAEAGELVEVLEGPLSDEKTGLERVRVKAVSDAIEGWMTLKGNQGTPFLKEADKPYYALKKEASLDEASKGGSGQVRLLTECEVVELLSGPVTEVVADVTRAKVKAAKDNATGWITIKDSNEEILAKPSEELVIKQSVAITDGQDIKLCKVIRKLDAGEKFQCTGQPVPDGETGTFRVEGKALKDGKEGWITTKGSKGTVYAEAADKQYNVVKAVELQLNFKTGSAGAKRTLEAGEALTVLEGPKEEKSAPSKRIKVCALNDRAVGWITKSDALVKKWQPLYRCHDKVPLQTAKSALAAEGSEPVRELVKGEQVELLEGPVKDDAFIRMKCRALKDSAVGWVSLRDDKGKHLLD